MNLPPPQRDGDEVLLYLPADPTDTAARPHRKLYWLHPLPLDGAWRVRVPASRFDGWVSAAVPSDFPGGDKRSWRLATRYAQVRIRAEPPALGVSSAVLGEVGFEPPAEAPDVH